MISSREDLKKYILTSLGEPMIHVDVTDGQLNDRIDEAVDFFQQFHADGTVRCYLKQRVTASELYIRECIPTDIEFKGEIIGKDSGAVAKLVSYSNGAKSNNHTFFCCDLKPNTFINNEKINVKGYVKGKAYNFEFTYTQSKLGIIDEREIVMPPYVLGVVQIFPVCQASSTNNLFNNQYQMIVGLDVIRNISDTSLIYYEQAMEHIDLIDFELNPRPQFEYNRHENRVVPQMRWGYDVSVGDYILMEVYRMIDPKKASTFWNDIFLKRYSVALTKRQWGANLRKYNGLQLPGGATLSGAEMYQEAEQEVQRLEEQQMQSLPPSAFFIG